MARPRQISDEDIFAAVRRAVGETGSRLSLDLVAERLGVTPPALFKRFGSKNALLLAALRPGRPPFLEALADGPDDRPLPEQLVWLFETMGTWFAEHMPRMMALHECGVPVCDLMDAVEEAPPVVIIRALSKWLQRGSTRGVLVVGDPQTAAMAMLGAVSERTFINYLLRRTTAARRELRRDAEHLSDLFVNGLVRVTRPVRRTPAPRKRT